MERILSELSGKIENPSLEQVSWLSSVNRLGNTQEGEDAFDTRWTVCWEA